MYGTACEIPFLYGLYSLFLFFLVSANGQVTLFYKQLFLFCYVQDDGGVVYCTIKARLEDALKVCMSGL